MKNTMRLLAIILCLSMAMTNSCLASSMLDNIKTFITWTKSEEIEDDGGDETPTDPPAASGDTSFFGEYTPTASPTIPATVPPTQPPTPAPTAAPVYPGIGDYTGAFRVSVSSNYVNKSSSAKLTGEMTVDGNLNTAWNTDRNVSGEWIELAVQDGRTYAIAGFRIANGYWKSDKVYRENTRPRTVEAYADGTRYIGAFTIQDTKDLQTFMFPQAVNAGSIRLTIVDGYNGSKYSDTAITELELLGPGVTAFDTRAVGDWGACVVRLQRLVTSGGSVARGDSGMAVLGLQVLLRDAFGVLESDVDGEYGGDTKAALEILAQLMEDALGSGAEPISPGVVNLGYWNNMMAYARQLYGGGASGAGAEDAWFGAGE